MINLIPNQDKKEMTRDFYLRLAALSLAMLGCCVLLAAVLMLPAYFSVSIKKNFVDTKLAMQAEEVVPEIDQQSLSTIKDLNGKLNIIESAEKNTFVVSANVIQEVLSKKIPDIKITQISYVNDPIKGKVITVVGTAASRDSLLSFRQALGADSNFKSVDLPISNFLGSTDIPFSLTLIHS